MPNNLRALRNARSLNQSEAAAALGTTLSQYAKLERGDRRLSDVWIERAAAAYGIDAGEVVGTQGRPVPKLGAIEAGGVVRWLGGEPPACETRGGLTISAGALGTMLDGWTLVTSGRRVASKDLIDRRPYLLDVNGWVLRTVHAARMRGVWHLAGFNVAPSFDHVVRQALECESLRW